MDHEIRDLHPLSVGNEELLIPEGVSDADAVALSLVGVTAQLGLVRNANLKAGEILFVNGGSGGVGSCVVQMAKILGARVITTGGTDEKVAACRDLGADLAINYKTQDVVAAIKGFGPEGVNVWWETLREPDFDRTIALLATRGRMILMAGRDARPPFPVGPFYVKDCSLHGLAMFNASAREQRTAANAINRWLAEGKLRARIDRVLPLAQAAEAHRLQEESTVHKSGALAGKLVLNRRTDAPPGPTWNSSARRLRLMKTRWLLFAAAFTLLAALAAQASKAVVNADGVLEIDGQKVFVIGFTAGPPSGGKTPDGKEAFAELADAGATFVRAGPEQPWSEARFELERAYEEAAARHGLHCWLNLREASKIKAGDAKSEALRKVLTAFREHPGLGAYKGEDEPEWGKKALPPLERAYQIIKELDPNHPLVIIEAPRGTIESLRKYNPVSDITGADIYPVGYPPGKHSQFVKTNAEISMVGDYTRRMMEVAEGKKPVWMTLQISWSGVLKQGQTLRFPTFAEQRFMTYEAIINGARGINYFGGGLPGGLNEEDRKLGWNWHF